ncbi:MAG: UDP-N-acetylmuramate--L-alanine ligase [Saccharofermentanaceae bacterium]|nr:UDP-N-acetylmuramate--L-alanine ligase [Saccharofermentanaceae bacterium]
MAEGMKDLPSGKRAFFVGIGGISMSGLARIACNYGLIVGGSDMHPSERTHELQGIGVKFYDHHSEENIKEFAPDIVVHTAAILPGNPELEYSRKNGLTVMERSVFLGLITKNFANVINISGTHGKTTTTSMVSLILLESGANPTVHLGAELEAFHGSVYLGSKDQLLVSEACEYHRSFLEFYSTIAAITNIDYDHVDCYSSIDEVIDVFAEFTEKLSDEGTLVIPAGDKNVQECVRRIPACRAKVGKEEPRILTTGLAGEGLDFFKREPDFCAVNIEYTDGKAGFDVLFKGRPYTHIQLAIPGTHNVYNALTAIACASLAGGTANAAQKALSSFTGAEGRFTIKGTFKGAMVVTDYAHHPSAARATLDAASHVPHNKTWVVFQPLTFSRTKVLFEDYVTSLLPCEAVFFDEIFSDREVNPGDISSKDIADEINRRGGHAIFFESKDAIVEKLSSVVSKDDMILILGPEDIRALGDRLVSME